MGSMARPHRWAVALAAVVVLITTWTLPREAEGQIMGDEPTFGPVFVADGETGRVVVYNTSKQTVVLDILLQSVDGTDTLLGAFKGAVVPPGGMAAAQYQEPVNGTFRTELAAMVRVLEGSPRGLRSSFQLVESSGTTRSVDGTDSIARSIDGSITFLPVGLLNETARLAAFNFGSQTTVIELVIIDIATNTEMAEFKGAVLAPHSSASVQYLVGGTRKELVGVVRVLQGNPTQLTSSFQAIGTDNRTDFVIIFGQALR